MKSMIMAQLAQYSKKTRLIIMGMAGLLLGAILFFYYEIANNRVLVLQTQRSKVMLHELGTIQSQIEVFLSNTNNPKQQSALNTIQHELAILEQSMVEIAKTSDIQKVSNQIASIKEDVDLKMNTMTHAMMSHHGDKQYLNASALPFQVIAVDMIAGLPYVSVNYNNHVLPLAVGDSLGGWQVVSVYSGADVAEFMNDKNQYIKITL